jgi:hypothetical protein
MKSLNFLLVIIVIFLILIASRLIFIGILMERFSEHAGLFIKSNQSLINSNHNLEIEIAGLRKQIADLSINFTKK